MGREWYFAGRSSKRGVVVGGGGGGGEAEAQEPSGCMCAVFQLFDFHPFHFPNINQQQTSFKPPSCSLEDHTRVSKGAEAPRNSLESEDGDGHVSSLSSKEEDFKIPKNIVQIKTSGGTTTGGGNLNDLPAEITSSPGTKTPTLVARLMGLDLLPGTHSPSFSSSSSSCLSTPNPLGNVPHLHRHLRHKQHIQTKHRNSIDSSDIAATRSLPETPRISSSRRSDVDYHHRFSLQINKENMNLGEDLELPRLSFSKRKCDENNGRSPSHYARQIVKQVKESVGRKVGQDITNSLKTREEIVGQLKSKKSPKTSSLKAIDESETSPLKAQPNTSSYSPRLRFIDKHKPSATTTPSPLTPDDQNMLKLPPPPPPVNTQLPRVLTKPKPQVLLLPQQQDFHQNNPKCKKSTNEKFNSRLKRPPQTSDIIRNKQEESFIIRPTSPTRASDTKSSKSKKTHPLSSNLLNNINSVPNLLPVKIDHSPPATKILSKQSQVCDSQESKSSSQLSSCSRQKYKQEGTTALATRETSQNKPNGASATTGGAPQSHTPQELHYITAILARTTALNVEGTPTNPTLLSLHRHWFSPTHPLNPSIFLHLEDPAADKDLSFAPKDQLGHRWNRKLLFDLVDEILKEILQEREKRLWFSKDVAGCRHSGSVVERVWKRVGEFPRAKCEVLEDIDGLIEGEDMEREKDGEGLEEEGEGLVAEIEGNIWGTLVHETVMLMDLLGKCENREIIR
ncbi:unnamed protein product [Sphenostylis stenocarpa]|uniref:DUF4378 domain-containing protein n=1 Tax=Sphenostylis stenocarpa TaxID=92480 RepID=A0AA86VH24_9FABA|nr:unnamed protein product [Sphenostylis stenocarpa]